MSAAKDDGTFDEANPSVTPDGHHIVVNGRRWRATDRGIPEKFRAELVHELMAARRAVRAGDDEARAAARRRVADAKVALGERGEPWWETPSEAGRAERIGATVRALLRHRSPTSSICPSDVARSLGGASWRDLMDPIRVVVDAEAERGAVTVTQGDRTVVAAKARGPVRIRRGPSFPDPPAD